MLYYIHTKQGTMFKLQLQWQKQGEWIDTVYAPTEYATAFFRWRQYQELWGDTHTYRLLDVTPQEVAQAS